VFVAAGNYGERSSSVKILIFESDTLECQYWIVDEYAQRLRGCFLRRNEKKTAIVKKTLDSG